MGNRSDEPMCAAMTKAGKPCKRRSQPDGKFCRMHDPDLALEIAEQGSRGGSVKPADRREPGAPDAEAECPATIEGVRRAIADAIADVRMRKITANEGQAIAQLARSFMATYKGEAEKPDGFSEIPTANLVKRLVEVYPEEAKGLPQ